MVKKYGNIYFYQPHEHQLPVHSDPARAINIHGQNSSGKSYNAAAWISEEVTGFSQYRTIRQTPFGVKRIWIVTTSYQIQENSSQSLLFSNTNAVVKDIGLLPSLETVESSGGAVVWEKGSKAGILKKVVMPDRRVEIEFKSLESGGFSMAGAAVDVIWVDEIAPEYIYNELVTRVLRKDGRLIMSYLVGGKKVNGKIPGEWVVTDLYPDYEDEIEKTGTSSKSFYFFTIHQNESLDAESVKEIVSLTTASERKWRFMPGGKFNLDVDGTKVFAAFIPELHEEEDLCALPTSFDVVYRAWDLGYAHPSCTAFLLDKYNRVRILFNTVGTQILLNDFIPVVERLARELIPQVDAFHELLPHDANRKYDTSPKSSRMIFQDSDLIHLDVIYIHAEDAILDFNRYLQRLIKGEPAVLIDRHRASKVISALKLHTRNEKTGNEEDSIHSHPADNCKMIAQFLKNKGLISEGQLARMEIVTSGSYYLDAKEPYYGE